MHSLDTSDTLSERSSSAEELRLDTRPISFTAGSLTEVQKTKVQFYDHGNRYEGDHQREIKVERVFSHACEVSLVMHAYSYVVCGHYMEARLAQL
jgi:hypothetical protein